MRIERDVLSNAHRLLGIPAWLIGDLEGCRKTESNAPKNITHRVAGSPVHLNNSANSYLRYFNLKTLGEIFPQEFRLVYRKRKTPFRRPSQANIFQRISPPRLCICKVLTLSSENREENRTSVVTSIFLLTNLLFVLYIRFYRNGAEPNMYHRLKIVS